MHIYHIFESTLFFCINVFCSQIDSEHIKQLEWSPKAVEAASIAVVYAPVEVVYAPVADVSASIA